MNRELLGYALSKASGYLQNFTMDLITQYLSNQSEEIDCSCYKSLPEEDEIRREIENLQNSVNECREQQKDERRKIIYNADLFWNTRTFGKNPEKIVWSIYGHSFESAITKEEYINKYIEEYENGLFVTTLTLTERSLEEVIKFLQFISIFAIN